MQQDQDNKNEEYYDTQGEEGSLDGSEEDQFEQVNPLSASQGSPSGTNPGVQGLSQAQRQAVARSTADRILGAITSLTTEVRSVSNRVRIIENANAVPARSQYTFPMPNTPARNNVTVRTSGGGAPRRNSIGATTPVPSVTVAQTLVTEYVIPENKMLKLPEPKRPGEDVKLPLRLVSWLYDTYNYYKGTSTDKTKTLVMFIHKSVIRKMLLKEKALGTALRFIDESSAYKCTDEETMQTFW